MSRDKDARQMIAGPVPDDAGHDFFDRARGLNRRILDRVARQRFVFHHVPKCGGTSVGRALRMRYLLSQATIRPESSFRAFRDFTGRDDTDGLMVDVLDLRKQMLLYMMHEDVRCLSLHVPFSMAAHRQFQGRYKFITLMREPVARFVSHYNWSRRDPAAHGYIPQDFDAFLDTLRARRIGAIYVKMFADQPNHADPQDPAGIAAALENLARFDLVGRLDDMAGFVAGVRRELGVKVRIGHENKARATPGQVNLRDLSPAQIDRVRALCAPDIAIWEGHFGKAG